MEQQGHHTPLANIAIAGGTGTIGKPVLEHLVKNGKHVTVLTRAGGRKMLPEDVKVAGVDYHDKVSLVHALQGQEMLILCLSVAAPQDTEDRLIDAAAEAGVKWIVPNVWSVDYDLMEDLPLGRPHAARNQRIEQLGMKWISVCCSLWYEHSIVNPQCFGFDIGSKTATFFDDGLTRVTTSTWDQCGRAVAALLSLPLQSDSGVDLMHWRNKKLYCSSFYVSQRDILESILRITGQRESEWTIKYEPAKDRLERGLKMIQEGDGSGSPLMVYGRTFQSDGVGDLRRKSQNEILGLPDEKIDAATRRAVEMFEAGMFYNPFEA